MNDSAKEKVAYLHGLMEGMKFDMTTDVGKVLKVMVEALDDLVEGDGGGRRQEDRRLARRAAQLEQLRLDVGDHLGRRPGRGVRKRA